MDIFHEQFKSFKHYRVYSHNGTYSIYINGNKYKTINFNENSTNSTYYVQIGSNSFKIEIGGPVITDMEFANSSTGKFLNFIT